MEQMNHLSLFSGYEGCGLGLRLAGLDIKTVGYCEYDKYCQEIIKQRIRDGYLDDAPIWPDVRTFDGRPFNGKVGILTAGFPCQPHSVAGKRAGASDERNLWPDTLRIIGEVGPRWVLLENVPGILVEFAGTVIGELAGIGYDAEWGVVSAADVGANHLRKRWWVLAHHDSERRRASGQDDRQRGSDALIGSSEHGEAGIVAHAQGQQRGNGDDRQLLRSAAREINAPTSASGNIDRLGAGWWQVEPDVGRVANGVAKRVDRLKALGNGIVPAVVAEFLRRLQI